MREQLAGQPSISEGVVDAQQSAGDRVVVGATRGEGLEDQVVDRFDVLPRWMRHGVAVGRGHEHDLPLFAEAIAELPGAAGEAEHEGTLAARRPRRQAAGAGTATIQVNAQTLSGR